MRYLLLLSWSNIRHKPLNLMLNILLFAMGVGLISFLLVLNHQLEQKFERNLADIDLVIGAKGSPLQLILCSMFHIDAPTGNIPLKEAQPFLNPRHPLIELAVPLSLGDNFRGYRIVGTDEKILTLYNGSLKEGELWKNDFDVVVGSNASRDLNLQVGSTFQSAHGLVDDALMAHDHQDFRVTGILKPTGTVLDQLILCSTETVWKVHQHDQDSIPEEEKQITSILIRFKGQSFQALNLARNINENTNLLAATPAIQINQLYANIGVGEKAIRGLALLIIFVSALSLFISLYASLRDRRYELAVMRVMGASAGRLFVLIITEGLFIAGLGALLGFCISHTAIALLADNLKEAYRYEFQSMVFLRSEAWIFLGALGIGLLAAFLPGISARNTEISKVLAEG